MSIESPKFFATESELEDLKKKALDKGMNPDMAATRHESKLHDASVKIRDKEGMEVIKTNEEKREKINRFYDLLSSLDLLEKFREIRNKLEIKESELLAGIDEITSFYQSKKIEAFDEKDRKLFQAEILEKIKGLKNQA